MCCHIIPGELVYSNQGPSWYAPVHLASFISCSTTHCPSQPSPPSTPVWLYAPVILRYLVFPNFLGFFILYAYAYTYYSFLLEHFHWIISLHSLVLSWHIIFSVKWNLISCPQPPLSTTFLELCAHLYVTFCPSIQQTLLTSCLYSFSCHLSCWRLLTANSCDSAWGFCFWLTNGPSLALHIGKARGASKLMALKQHSAVMDRELVDEYSSFITPWMGELCCLIYTISQDSLVELSSGCPQWWLIW